MSQVDVIALTRAENEVAAELVALQASLGGQKPDASFWAQVLTISHKLFEVGGVEEGFRVLAIVPPSYFRGPLLEQMKVDPDLADKAALVADKLLDAGRAKLPRYYFDAKQHIPRRHIGVA